ncbi:MAG: hypothetical protein KDK51_03505 [Deltaproteobacteria bacterium]|nr:hypothetical protein [Deltaproteobacteria bacterium]
MDQCTDVPDAIRKVLDQKALQRGFPSFEYMLKKENHTNKQVLYLVVKQYCLDTLMRCLESIFIQYQHSADIQTWYQRHWTKTFILAGNPQNLHKQICFDYYQKNIASLGPIDQSHKNAKRLCGLCIPLNCKPQSIKNFAYLQHSNGLKIVFADRFLSMPKVIVQLVHITMEMAIENGTFTPVTCIQVQPSISVDDNNIDHIRVDGGLTEVKAFTHIANAYRGTS